MSSTISRVVLLLIIVTCISIYCITYESHFDTSVFEHMKSRLNNPSDNYKMSIIDGANYTLVHHERIQHLNTMCKDSQLIANNVYKFEQSFFYYSEKYNFSYCKVPKAGCTFWTQVFLVLNDHSVEQTLSMGRWAIHGYRHTFSISPNNLKIINTRRILVSRDPYSRLYSGYIDKIYLGLLSLDGRYNPIEKTKCSLHTTFEQFLQYVIKRVRSNVRINRHWAPIFSLCNPCENNQYKLVKQETFANDVQLVLKEIGLGDAKFKDITRVLQDRGEKVLLNGIIKAVYMRNLQRNDFRDCIRFSSVAHRLWKAFQIQGYIKSDIEFPDNAFTNEDEYSNYTKLSELVKETLQTNKMGSIERKQQRNQALVSAYKSVSRQSIEEIKEIYKLDFRLFNYDENPPR